MKKRIIGRMVVAAVTVAMMLTMGGVPSITARADELVPVYEIYFALTGESLFTQDQNEVNYQIGRGWTNRGIAFYAISGGVNVYRIFNPKNGEHHYTKDQNEVNYQTSKGWRDEGLAFKVAEEGAYPVYRVFNKHKTGIGSHWYTIDEGYRKSKLAQGWNDENVAWYSAKAVQSGLYDIVNGVGRIINLDAIAAAVLKYTNIEREKAGLELLDTFSVLKEASMLRAQEMLGMNKLNNHIRPDGRVCSTVLDDFGVDTYLSGENSAQNWMYNSDDATGAALVNQWMNSPGHRENILTEGYKYMGVGIAVGSNGIVYANQVFIGELF